ncbi:MAG: hypothetical protein GX484_02500 [Chloroflexi bacterium]|nr:hypothetical protein [Chloroflexota bacterium]
MLSAIVYILPVILGLVAVIALITAFTNFRRARTAPYFRIRRQSSQKAWRWTLVLILASAGAFAAVQAQQFVEPVELASLLPSAATDTPTFSPLTFPTSTIDLSLTPKDILEGPPTITPTEPPPTLSPTPYIATIQSTVTPPSDATLTNTGISSGLSPDLQPVNVGDVFPVGTPRIYFWVEFDNMVNGVSWSRALLLDGRVVRTESEAWERGEEGVAYYWFDAQGGWPTGRYEVQFFIGDKLVDSATYQVVN